MFIERIDTEGLAQVAYVVGDDEAGVAAVIDPRRDVDDYLDVARRRGVRIVAVLETHVHADFLSGAGELAARTEAPIYCSAIGESAFPHTPVHDGDEIPVGRLRLRALWTPGHTPEHLSYLLVDPADGGHPRALFSGDVLFVGSVGRPDLLGTAHTSTLLRDLYDSIFHRLMPLPDDLAVYPGHGAGSACGRGIGHASTTTLGQEKRFNYAFQARDRAAFEQAILADLPPAPTYYPVMKQVNKAGPRPLADLPAGQPLNPQAVDRHLADGAAVIDARSPEAFAAGHLPGAVSVGLAGDFATWCGWLAPYDRAIVLVLEHPDEFSLARRDLWRIGLDRVAGYLAGGVEAWVSTGRALERLATVFPSELHDQLRRGEPIRILDVRSRDEWAAGHVASAQHVYAGLLAQDPGQVAGTGPVAVICGSGYRSSFAASLLKAARVRDLRNVVGGMTRWEAQGLPVVRASPSGQPGPAPD